MNHGHLKNSIISLVVIFLVFGAPAVFASGLYQNLNTAAGADLEKNSDLMKFLGAVVGGILGLLGVVLVIVIIYAGIVWGFLSNGEPAKIAKAKDMIKNAIIGLVIVFAAYGITALILDSLSKGANSSATPSLSPEKIEQIRSLPNF